MSAYGQVKRSLEDMQDGFHRLMIESGRNKTIRDGRGYMQVCMVNLIQVGNDRDQRCVGINESLRHPRPVIRIGIDIFFHLFLAGNDFSLFTR